MTDEIKKVEDEAPKVEQTAELSENALDNAVGGKVQLQDFNLVKNVDKASSKLM